MDRAEPAETGKIEGDVAAEERVADTRMGQLAPRLRLARKLKGLTLKALADRAGCSESLLSKFENGRATPSLPMLHRIVRVLDTNIGWMFEESPRDEGIVFRKGERPVIALDPKRRGEGISLERVIPANDGHLLQCNIHHIEPGGRSAGPIEHDGEEVGLVLTGRVELSVDGRAIDLNAGDAFVFRSNLAHSYRNPSDEPASIFWVNTPATF